MRALRSVRSQLLLMVSIVVLVAVGVTGWMSRRGTHVEFSQFISKLETQIVDEQSGVDSSPLSRELDVLGEEVQEHYRTEGSWDGTDRVLADAGILLDGRVALVIAGGDHVVASSEPSLHRAGVRTADDGRLEISNWQQSVGGNVVEARTVGFRGPSRAILTIEGATVGVIYVLPSPNSDEMPRFTDVIHQADFLDSVDRWIVGAVVMVGLGALLTAFAFSGRIVRPIEQLTEASRKMGGGDLSHRVDVGGEDEIGELARAFNSMADSLERNEQLRRNMVSDVAHELRTPLTNLRGQLEAVQDGLAEPTAELIASLHEETMLLNHLVDDLQDLALVEAGQLRMNLESVDVTAEIERAAALAGAAVAIDAPAAGTLPAITADAQRLRQILQNLLDNAQRHGAEPITVAARATDTSVRISVTDSGGGIAAEHLPNVFERFYRADPSRQRATGGAGLGLSIVKQLVEAQGGTVWAENVDGAGCTFGFELPLAP